jgi:nitrogen fixation protein FixH
MSAFLARRSHYIPWIFVAGFAVIIAVNGTMIWLALSSFSGLYTTKPREVGLRYNAVIAEQDKRDALGWRIDASWHRESAALPGTLVVWVSDASGGPLAGARMTAELVRPVEKMPPLGIAMTPVDIGRFEGHTQLPEHGNWDVDIVVERGRDRYALTRRMFLQ